MDHLVIMAGGAGSRLWPMSTPEKPKQFIDVLGVGRTLLQLTADRFAGICSPENIWVVTALKYEGLVREQLPGLPASQVLLEPEKRNTAPCIAYASWKIRKKDARANLIVSPSDHLVLDVAEFRRVIRKGVQFIDGKDRILTLGMYPTRPETGYGYIRAAKDSREEIRRVEGFKEKPDLQTAQAYLAAGGYFWNAGIFLWNVVAIEKALRTSKPEMAALFDELDEVYFTPREQEAVNRSFLKCENVSIDYAVMEHAPNIYVFPADFGWSDLGTWRALYDCSPKDSDGNVCVGDRVRIEGCRGCEIHAPAGRRMVIQGLEEYIVVEENGILLVCRKSEEERIKSFSRYFPGN